MNTIARVLLAVVAAFAAGGFTMMAFVLISMLLQSLQSQPAAPYGMHIVEGVARGFALAFVGSLVAPGPRRATAALCLIPVGIAAYAYGHAAYAVSSHGFPIWHLSACVVGGLVAAGIQAWRARRKSPSRARTIRRVI